MLKTLDNAIKPLHFSASLLIFVFLSATLAAPAQTGVLRGFVYDKRTSEPVLYANVMIAGTNYGAVTDANGFYTITGIPAGKHKTMATTLGYDTAYHELTISGNSILKHNFEINETSYRLEEATVSGQSNKRNKESLVSVVRIDPKDIEKMPAIGGQADLAQYLQMAPGVIFTGDQGGQLYIRGGSPVQNVVLLDGMTIFNPFHSIGFYSVIDNDIMQNADIYTGGFNVEYGGRISSVMDITTRDGNKKRLAGKVSTGTFLSTVLLEGPLRKKKGSSTAGSSFIVSAKSSYLDQSSKLFYPGIEDKLPYKFTDLYAKLNFTANDGSKFSVFGFDYRDKARFRDITEFNWNSSGLGSRVVFVPSSTPGLVEAGFAFSDYGISMDEADGLPRNSSIWGFRMGSRYTYYLGDNRLMFGVEAGGSKTDFLYHNLAGQEIQIKDNTNEFAVFSKYKFTNQRFTIEPGMRFHYYSAFSELSLEPRLTAKLILTSKIRLKAAAGLYSQNLVSSSSDHDVVNLFYGFISGPANVPREFRGETVDNKLQRARHAVFGVEYDINHKLLLNIETYYKYFTQLTNINRNKLYTDESYNHYIPDELKKDFILESGDAYGGDISLRYNRGRLSLWLVYSLTYVTRKDAYMEYHPHFDRRHNVNTMASYYIDRERKCLVSARWNYGSGFPFTQALAYYEKIPFDEHSATDYETENGELGIIYDKLNEARLPDYHRLDLSLERMFKFKNQTELSVVASVTNVYNRRNIFYFDRVSYRRIDQLPLLPSVSVSYQF